MEEETIAIWDSISHIVIAYSTKLAFTILFLLIGWWIINRVVKSANKIMEKRKVDLSLRPFLNSIVKYGLRILLFIAVAGMLGIEMTSFIAMLGAAGLAIGMALQGSLSNFAGGVIILVLKPFKVGNYIEANGHAGTVREIRVFHTYLTTLNRQEIILPNGPLANATIKNYSLYETRGLAMTFQVGYQHEISKVKAVLNDVLESEGDDLIKNPAHTIHVSELNDKYLTYNIQAWFKTDNYWPIQRGLKEKVIKRFSEEGITMPYDQTIKVEVNQQNDA